MSDYETIQIDRPGDGIAHISLNRPEKHNAMNAAMIAELHQVADELGADDQVRVVILKANGKSFCAGADLNWMADQAKKDRAGKITEATKLADMLQALDDMPKPLIGEVQGNAFGGGIGLMTVCDIVVAKVSAKFALTETRLGLIPATIGPYVVRRLGEGNARRCFMNAKAFDAAEAQRLGFVSVVAGENEVTELAMEEARTFLNCAPGAVGAAKELCKDLARNRDATISSTIEALADRWETDECQEGIAAFFEKRAAPWKIDK